MSDAVVGNEYFCRSTDHAAGVFAEGWRPAFVWADVQHTLDRSAGKAAAARQSAISKGNRGLGDPPSGAWICLSKQHIAGSSRENGLGSYTGSGFFRYGRASVGQSAGVWMDLACRGSLRGDLFSEVL